ncbi:autophagy protein 1 [Reticulomyxa filosa]|uniref:Autophagy protein 1 n=1 Tax=Reticulomyxa filosa TaxID=46433 RepID=X6N345_RETFI|nr:autophagy protein 1 [Reticulomyxa filosa]|eukprot:ETO20308.1 autophagy protein 1 [Reticulomyxa filosa]
MQGKPGINYNRKQVGDFILEKSIGFGSFSTVYEGRNVKTGEKVAVKSINLHRINLNAKHQTNLKQEIDILRKCQHTNIVQLLHTYQTNNHIYLVMQYCSGGDLHKFVQKNGPLKEPVAQYFSRQLANGLFYLHSSKIVHRVEFLHNQLFSKINICIKKKKKNENNNKNTTITITITITTIIPITIITTTQNQK